MGKAGMGGGERGFSSARRDLYDDCGKVAETEGAEEGITSAVLYSLDFYSLHLWPRTISNHALR